jgi:hypothetical protein
LIGVTRESVTLVLGQLQFERFSFGIVPDVPVGKVPRAFTPVSLLSRQGESNGGCSEVGLGAPQDPRSGAIHTLAYQPRGRGRAAY